MNQGSKSNYHIIWIKTPLKDHWSGWESKGKVWRLKNISQRLKRKVVQMDKLWKGYKIISRCVDIPVSTAGSIIRKWKLPHTIQALPIEGHPSSTLCLVNKGTCAGSRKKWSLGTPVYHNKRGSRGLNTFARHCILTNHKRHRVFKIRWIFHIL